MNEFMEEFQNYYDLWMNSQRKNSFVPVLVFQGPDVFMYMNDTETNVCWPLDYLVGSDRDNCYLGNIYNVEALRAKLAEYRALLVSIIEMENKDA